MNYRKMLDVRVKLEMYIDHTRVPFHILQYCIWSVNLHMIIYFFIDFMAYWWHYSLLIPMIERFNQFQIHKMHKPRPIGQRYIQCQEQLVRRGVGEG